MVYRPLLGIQIHILSACSAYMPIANAQTTLSKRTWPRLHILK